MTSEVVERSRILVVHIGRHLPLSPGGSVLLRVSPALSFVPPHACITPPTLLQHNIWMATKVWLTWIKLVQLDFTLRNRKKPWFFAIFHWSAPNFLLSICSTLFSKLWLYIVCSDYILQNSLLSFPTMLNFFFLSGKGFILFQRNGEHIIPLIYFRKYSWLLQYCIWKWIKFVAYL